MKGQHIFISYARIDAAFALKLAQGLREAGKDIWIDQLDIDPGKRWDQEIEKGLKEAKKLMLILSPNSVASENVLDEISYALEEKKKIIPILYQECEVPFRLRRLQYVDFSQDYETGMRRLTEYFKTQAENPSPLTKAAEALNTPQSTSAATSSTPPAAEQSSLFKNKSILWMLAATVFLLAAFFIYKNTGKTETDKIETVKAQYMPSLSNLTEQEAKAKIKEIGLAVGTIAPVESKEVKPGLVVTQQPPAGAELKDVTSVNLRIAIKAAEELIEIPKLIGVDQKRGTELLKKIGLTPNSRMTASNCSKKPGVILSQLPSAGKKVKKGSDVQIDIVPARKKIKAGRVGGSGKMVVMRPGKKFTKNAWALKNTGIEFSMSGDECSKGEVRISHGLGGTKVFNLKAGERGSNSRLFGVGAITVQFLSSDKNARLSIRIW